MTKDHEIVYLDGLISKKEIKGNLNNIVINNEHYFYKIINFLEKKEVPLNEIYNEMIQEKMANKIGINTIDTNIAKFKKYYGALAKDYRTPGFNVISGKKILTVYFEHLEEEKQVKEILDLKRDIQYPIDENLKIFLIEEMNNLENIWDALNYFLTDIKIEHKDYVLYEITREMVKRFILDFFAMQIDRHSRNWEILVSDDFKEVKLAPLYDNVVSLEESWKTVSIKTQLDDKVTKTRSDVVKDFLTTSNEYFKNMFLDIFYDLNLECVIELIKELENDKSFELPYMYKSDLIRDYKLNYRKIEEIIKDLRLHRSVGENKNGR